MSEEKTSVHSIADLLGEARQQNAYLIQISAKSAAGIGRMLKLEKTEVVLGRSTEAQFQVEDDGISRKHAKVMLGLNGHFQLLDLGSTNGTFLNGIKVDVAVLQDGDKIQIGQNTVFKFSIQDQLEEQYQKSIYESATRDGLTRIFNKKYFLDTLRKEFAYCLRHRVPLSMVMFDVDHFKKINDTYGHPAGDYCLARIAQRVTETVRIEDLFARYGGEEFVLMLRESA
ncbi:MAG: diguanylate cyclase, partial [Myxococcaceae bacterium]